MKTSQTCAKVKALYFGFVFNKTNISQFLFFCFDFHLQIYIYLVSTDIAHIRFGDKEIEKK